MTLQLITHAAPDPRRLTGSLGPARSHFGQRAAERGIASVPGDALKLAVEWSVARQREDLAEPVFALADDGARVFRILLPEGPFYAIVSPAGVAVTLYDRAMLRRVRKGRRRKLRRGGRRKGSRRGMG